MIVSDNPISFGFTKFIFWNKEYRELIKYVKILIQKWLSNTKIWEKF